MSKNILVIDDDEAIRKSFKLALEDTGYNLDTAETGEIGIQRQNDNKYDLIFLDMKMPGLNGAETLREIRKNDPTLPVYIVTAFAKEFLEDLESVTNDGLRFELMRKPIGNDEIVEIAKAVLEN